MRKCRNNKNQYCASTTYCDNYRCSPMDENQCKHTDTHLAVLEVTPTCETTALKCANCGKVVSKPQKDCR